MRALSRLRRGLLAGALAVLFAAPSQAGERNEKLLDLLRTPFGTVPEFEVWLRGLESCLLERNDSRAVFAAMYVVLTEQAGRALSDGVFEDEPWVEAFTVTFGRLYQRAFLDYETGRYDRVPRAWIVAFETAEANESSVFMNAALGIHAHINHDMPFALGAVTPPGARRDRLRDFYRTNVAIIVASIEGVESMLAEHYDERLGRLDDRFGMTDERLLKSALTSWRFVAWRRSTFFDGSLPPDEAEAWARHLDELAGEQAYQLLANPLLRLIGGDP